MNGAKMNDPELETPPPDPLDELLVAYLDGELSPAEADDVERRLATDVSLRSRLQLLERASDMLGVLPRSAPTEQFAHKTVTMAVMTAEEEVAAVERKQKAGWAAWSALGAVATTAALIVGFVVVRQRLNAPNEHFRRDLPVIQRLDEYRTADSVDFLRDLERAGLFVVENEDAL